MPGEPITISSPEALRSKLNSSGATLIRGRCVIPGATEDRVVLPAASTDLLLGVVKDGDILDGAYGTIQIRGVALCRASAALATPGIALMANSAGRVLAHANGNAVIGFLLNTATALDDLVEVELAGPASFR